MQSISPSDIKDITAIYSPDTHGWVSSSYKGLTSKLLVKLDINSTSSLKIKDHIREAWVLDEIEMPELTKGFMMVRAIIDSQE